MTQIMPYAFDPGADDLYEPMICDVCNFEMEWDDCDMCGGSGYSYHDCGEDCCCCLDPEDNVTCDQCEGLGGWWYCLNTDSIIHLSARLAEEGREAEGR